MKRTAVKQTAAATTLLRRLGYTLQATLLLSLTLVSLLVLLRGALLQVPASPPPGLFVALVLAAEVAVVFARTDLISRSLVWLRLVEPGSHNQTRRLTAGGPLTARCSLPVSILASVLQVLLVAGWWLLAPGWLWIVFATLAAALAEGLCWWAVGVRLHHARAAADPVSRDRPGDATRLPYGIRRESDGEAAAEPASPLELVGDVEREGDSEVAGSEEPKTANDEIDSDLEARLLARLSPNSGAEARAGGVSAPGFAEEAASRGGSTAGASQRAASKLSSAASSPSGGNQEIPGEQSLDEQVWLSLCRTRQGNIEQVRGDVREAFAPGQQTVVSHVVLHPPLAATPQLELTLVAGPEATSRVTQVETFGFRVEWRLRRPATEGGTLFYNFTAFTESDHVGPEIPPSDIG